MPVAMTGRAPSTDGKDGNGPLRLPFSIDLKDYAPHMQFMAEIGAVHRQWQAVMDHQLREYDLTHVRWLTLWRIAESETALNQTDLARRVGIESSTLVRQLDILEERGLIERVVEKDRRARQIRLTPAAFPILELVKDVALRLGRDTLAGADPEQVAQGLAVLRGMRERLRERQAAAPELSTGE